MVTQTTRAAVPKAGRSSVKGCSVKIYQFSLSDLQIEQIRSNNSSPITHYLTKPRYIAGHCLDPVLLCRRKQDRASDPAAPSKKPQAAKWLFAAFLFFDSIPHNSLSNFRELWGMLSNCLSGLYSFGGIMSEFGKKTSFAYRTDSAGTNRLRPLKPEPAPAYIRLHFLFSTPRAPPLLKF